MFWKKKNQKALETQLMDVEQKLDTILDNLKNSTISQEQKASDNAHASKHTQPQTVEYHFHIEQVDIHSPKLDELKFQLDALDIEELSGSLNIGNNFTTEHKKQKFPSPQKQTSSFSSSTKGYTVSFNEKEE